LNLASLIDVKSKIFSGGIAVFVSVLLAGANFLFAERDGWYTANVVDYSTSRLASANDFDDHPMQTIYTYFNREANFLNPGVEGYRLPFHDRLEMYFGESLGDREILDVRERFSEGELAALEVQVDTQAFVSKISCPHNYDLTCQIGLTWDRTQSRSPNVNFVVIRYAEEKYAIIDDVLLTAEGDG
jgi:hypothetical protein